MAHRLSLTTLFLILALAVVVISLVNVNFFTAIHNSGIPFWGVGISAGAGLIFLVGARMQFRHADAEIMTFKKPRNLVTSGLYRFSRNPMFLGFLILLIAFALYINIWQASAAPIIFFLAANYRYIPEEENNNKEKFGNNYVKYKNRSRRRI